MIPKAKEADYTNASQQLAFAVVETLSRNLLNPQPLTALVEALAPIEASRDQIFRALWNLQKAGWVQTCNEGYLLAPELTRLSDRLRLRLVEIHRQYLESEIS